MGIARRPQSQNSLETAAERWEGLDSRGKLSTKGRGLRAVLAGTDRGLWSPHASTKGPYAAGTLDVPEGWR